jgi:hypothetical protein
LLTTPIWKYVKLELAAGDDAHVALAFDNGDPAIVESRCRRGRVIVFATAASPDSMDRSVDPPTPWSALGAWPSFPPLVQESLSLVTRGREEGRNRLVGETLSSQLYNATSDTRLTMTPPASENRRTRAIAPREVRLESEGDAWRWSYGDTSISGIYELKISRPLDQTERFAVNLEPQESPLERIDARQLPRELASAMRSDAASPATFTGSGAATYAWFRQLIIAVVVLLALESLLGRWFGGGRA